MQDQFISIDIHTNKLPDWLISRRHCIRDWQPSVQLIREKINNAIQDMPIHEGVTRLLSGTYINYFHCLKIVEILKETEADTRSFFGRYGSQRMKDWQEIVKLYERNNVYLSEAAQILCRSVQFEIPSVIQQIAKCEQIQNECKRKETELKKKEKAAYNDFNSSCQKLGIKGEKIKKELAERCLELPKVYVEMAQGLSSLADPIREFSMKELFLVTERGNTTTYEWIHKEKPLKVEEPSMDISVEDEEKQEDVIDFGDIKLESGGIDFGDDVQLETGDIDWSAGDDIQFDDTAGVQEIDFNISLDECGIEVQEGGLEGGVASGNDALTLLDNPDTRTDFINELLELESFLKMRVQEMKLGGSDLLSLSQLQNADTFLQVQTTDSVQNLLVPVQDILSKMNDPLLYQLHNIRHSPKYVDSLAKSLKHKLLVVNKSIEGQHQVCKKGVEQGQLAEELRPKLKIVVIKTKELQRQIEQAISKKLLKGRPVNLMGGANTIEV